MPFPRRHWILLAVCLLAGSFWQARAQSIPVRLYEAMRWRSIGPFRGGRALAVVGVPSEPTVFYFGSVDGGVWKTTNAGLTWEPLFQHQPVASVGAIAVAPSDPRVIYVGTGEADMRSDISIGDGIYKSMDAGRTWNHLGLSQTSHIGRILVDPRNPNLVLVAALGHAYDANPQRGVYRSTDGGRTWRKVLYENENTGAIDLAMSPDNPKVVYAALWQTRRPPWTQYPPNEGPGSGIYKSTDEGETWIRLSGHGLPSGQLGRIGLAAASGNRVYALIDCTAGGLYRSDDGGRDWRHVSGDPGIWSRGWYFGRVTVDPKNPDVVWVPNVALYRSTDGGRTFTVIKGAPGGDDYHILWIDPRNPRRMILGSDQGTVISVDGGATWSSWYNQPTGQFYHISTDHRIPYWVYGSQQDSGTVGTPSRGVYGSLSFRDWRPVGGGESGYVVPDPTDPHIVYGGDTYGVLHKWNAVTRQSETISPDLVAAFGASPSELKYRFTWTSPIVFSPWNPKLLYYGSQYLLETADGGSSWREASPDLTVRPGTAGNVRRGVIYTIAPSPVRAGEIWIGTDNGLIQLTLDGGKTWKNVTPPALTAWSKISLIEASHFDPATAYAAIDRHRLGDDKPYIYITHDYGKDWTQESDGIEAPAYVHVVREDPVRRGLLFAGAETGVYVSFNDGKLWQSLQLNLPTTSIRDLAIEQGDLIAATHGRGIWILDDISLLRQLNRKLESLPFHLFAPRTAYRTRRSVNTDTPLPPEVPQGRNPPAGEILYYWLGSASSGPVTLDILDANGKLVRRYSSAERPKPVDINQYPVAAYWLEAPQTLSARPGIHRFVWDFHYPRPESVSHDFPMTAIPHETPLAPQGPLAAPGRYTVSLSVGGATQTQSFELRMDPKVTTPQSGLEAQLALALEIAGAMDRSYSALSQVKALQQRLEALPKRTKQTSAKDELKSLESKLASLAAGNNSLDDLNSELGMLLEAVESADVSPSINAQQTWAELKEKMGQKMADWQSVRKTDLPRLNRHLQQAGLAPVTP
jgi:photosystem II stability/assembly factor-like uncharacterized protein